MDISALVKEYGHRNVRVMMDGDPLILAGIIPGIAFSSSSSPKIKNVEFEIDVERYDPTEDFKIKFVPADPMLKKSIASRTFYTMDFNHAVEAGGIRVMLLTIDGYSTLFYAHKD